MIEIADGDDGSDSPSSEDSGEEDNNSESAAKRHQPDPEANPGPGPEDSNSDPPAGKELAALAAAAPDQENAQTPPAPGGNQRPLSLSHYESCLMFQDLLCL